MEKRQGTAFDRLIPSATEFRIAIGPDALRHATPESLRRLTGIAQFRNIVVHGVCASERDVALVTGCGIAVAELQLVDDHYVLRHPDGGFSVGSKARTVGIHPAEAPLPAWWPEYALAAERLYPTDRDYYDAVVMSPRALAASLTRLEPSIGCTIEEVFRRVRLFQVASDYVEPTPHFHVNVGFYRTARVHLLFGKYQRAWTSNRHNDTITQHFTSVFQRLEFIVASSDAACIAALRRPNNDTESEALYHLGYFAMLAAGVLEDLAAIVVRYFALKVSDFRWVTLRMPKHKESDLVKRLRGNNDDLASFLSLPSTRVGLTAIYEIRDQIQHRTHPVPVGHSVSRGGGVRRVAGTIDMPSSALEALKSSTTKPLAWSTLPGWKDGFVMVSPYELVLAELDVLATLFREIVARLPVPPSEERANDRSGDPDWVAKGDRWYFGWPAEPLILDS